MKLTIASLAFAAMLSPAASAQEMSPAARAGLDNFAQSVLAVRECRAAGGAQCEWRELTYSINDQFSGNITVMGGPTWRVSCRYDRIERDDICSFAQNGFRLSSINGVEWVSWGGEAYPGSDKIAQLGNGEPIRWPESSIIDHRDAEMVIEIMSMTPTSLYRWFDWPNNRPHDIEVDNKGLEDAVRLFRAIRAVHEETH